MSFHTNTPRFGNIFVVADTFADLRNVSSSRIRDGYIAATSGKLSIADKNGGIFVWDASSIAADDNATVLAPADGGKGRWIASGRGLKGDVGATGTGIETLATDSGASLVKYKVPYDRVGRAGAKGRALDDKLGRDLFSITDFADGPVELLNAFDLLNAATGATETHSGNTSSLAREILVPMPLTFPAQDKSVFVRKGQTIRFTNGAQLDLTATTANTKPVFDVGRKSDGTMDPGGLPPRILYLSTLGGPSAAAVLRVSDAVAGYTVFAPFFTSAGIAMDLQGSGDGLIDMVQIDQCLTGVIMGGQNNNIGLMNCYNTGYDMIVQSNTYDCAVNYLHSEYYQNASVLFGDGATNILGFRIGTHKGIQNAQNAGSTGFVSFRSNNAEASIGHAEYRNGKGAAIRVNSGLGNRLFVDHLLCDGRKTNALYNSSADMGAISWANGTLVVKALDANFLGSQPVLIGGSFQTQAAISNARFEGNTGGASEILVSSSGTGSDVRLYNIWSSRGDAARYYNSGTGTVGGNP